MLSLADLPPGIEGPNFQECTIFGAASAAPLHCPGAPAVRLLGADVRLADEVVGQEPLPRTALPLAAKAVLGLDAAAAEAVLGLGAAEVA